MMGFSVFQLMVSINLLLTFVQDGGAGGGAGEEKEERNEKARRN